jgi:hypothetical protein
MSGKLSAADAKAFVEYYQPLYFNDVRKEEVKEKLGSLKRALNGTERDVEKYIVEELGKYKDDDFKIRREFIAWKSGQLKKEHISSKPEKLGNIRISRNKIVNLDEYLDAINGEKDDLQKQLLDDNDVQKTFNDLLKLQDNAEVKPFGSVYIITLIYFLSGGTYPIYDQFAHRAVKALYFGFNPMSIYVGGAPDKHDDAVMAMYKEYLFLLEGVFGTYHISREQDQALWVYGHSQKGYKDAPDIGFKDFK